VPTLTITPRPRVNVLAIVALVLGFLANPLAAFVVGLAIVYLVSHA
jgi:hypothetical protein